MAEPAEAEIDLCIMGKKISPVFFIDHVCRLWFDIPFDGLVGVR